MGLFSRLFGKKKNQTSCTVTAGAQRQNQQQQNNRSNQSNMHNDDHYMNPPAADLRSEVRSIFNIEFSMYQVQENVEITQIDPSANFGGPIDFAVYNNGRLVAILMLLNQKGKRNKRIYGAMLAAQKNGIPFLNLYVHFPYSRQHAIAYIRRNAKI
ncbi:MAG: hypothetical protein FWE03_05910 [Firmicutes bacterium]|nr:hypothetical protein [Bacillota bacterium]